MKTLNTTLATALLAAVVGLSSCSEEMILPKDPNTGNPIETPDNGNKGNTPDKDDNSTSLFSDVPEPSNARFVEKTADRENGEHKYYTTNEDYNTATNNYAQALKNAGWNIVYQNSGGWGQSGGGTVKATMGAKYLKFHVGGNGYPMHIDLCVWPQRPYDDDCDHQPDNN